MTSTRFKGKTQCWIEW